MGVKTVTLYDSRKATLHDLSTQFYLREADVGLGRARACLQRLRELNPNVKVEVTVGPLAPPLLAQHSVIVLTGELMTEVVVGVMVLLLSLASAWQGKHLCICYCLFVRLFILFVKETSQMQIDVVTIYAGDPP